jgi:GT2 family glycosyltransferase
VGYRLGTMERDGDLYDRPRRVFGACAGAALYRRSMLERLGLFDEDFFAYLEDVDLNFRANRAGFTCRYIPAARVYHIGSATSGSRVNPFTVRLSTRNNFFLVLKNYPLSFFIRFLAPILVYQFFWLLFVIKKGQFGSYLSGAAGFAGKIGPALAKRKEILAGPGIADRELVRRILDAERDVIVSIMRRRESQGKGNGMLNLYARLFL